MKPSFIVVAGGKTSRRMNECVYIVYSTPEVGQCWCIIIRNEWRRSDSNTTQPSPLRPNNITRLRYQRHRLLLIESPNLLNLLVAFVYYAHSPNTKKKASI